MVCREPGGTKIGEELRTLLKHVSGEDQACDTAELLMFSAARAQLLNKVILPHLDKGGIAVCDRFLDSTSAYQGYGRGLDLDLINKAHSIAVGINMPDLTFLFNLDPRTSRKRYADCGGEEEDCNFEKEELEFHNRVMEGYKRIASREPDRFVYVDASMSIADVTKELRTYLKNTYGKKN